MPSTAYTPTTDQPITRYQPVLLTAPANTARFDHDPITGESLGLLIEEQRTNLLKWSEDFSNAAFNKVYVTVLANATIAPDGTLSADKIVAGSNESIHYITIPGVTTIGATQTFSLYVKLAGISAVTIADAGIDRSVFNLTTATVSSPAGITNTITSVGNGWYRITSTRTWKYVTPYVMLHNNTSSFVGDGYSGIYIWGAQLEGGAFPASYIKTEASQVTRAADNASMTGANFSSWYRQDAGTLFANISDAKMSATVHASIASITDNPVSKEWVSLNHAVAAYASVFNGSTVQASIGSSTSIASGGSLAVAYAVNDFAFSVAGGSVVTDTSGTIQNPAMLKIGVFAYNPGYLNGHIKRLTYYPKRLSNTQLQAITA